MRRVLLDVGVYCSRIGVAFLKDSEKLNFLLLSIIVYVGCLGTTFFYTTSMNTVWYPVSHDPAHLLILKLF